MFGNFDILKYFNKRKLTKFIYPLLTRTYEDNYLLKSRVAEFYPQEIYLKNTFAKVYISYRLPCEKKREEYSSRKEERRILVTKISPIKVYVKKNLGTILKIKFTLHH